MDDENTTGLTTEELSELLKARIQTLLQVVRLESAGRPIEPTGFRISPRSEPCGD